MHRQLTTAAILAASALLLPLAPARAQCTQHVVDEYAPSNIKGATVCTAMFDDGSGTGPCLFAGGELWIDNVFCTVAKLVEGRWTSVGLTGSGTVRTLAVFDDGSGPALYAGGILNTTPMANVAKWNGSAWTPLPFAGNARVESLAQFPPGPGGTIYAAVDVSSNQLLRLNGAAWEPVPNTTIAGCIYTLKALNHGSGPKLYIGGDFTSAGGSPASGIATWNGSVCQPLGTGLVHTSSYVHSIALHDDGSGPKVHIAGRISPLPATSQVAALVGNTWTSVLADSTGNYREATGLVSITDDQGPALYVAGGFQRQSANRVKVLRNGAWSNVGGEFSANPITSISTNVHSLEAHATPSGTVPLAVGGMFRCGQLMTSTVATLRNNTWLSVQPQSQVPNFNAFFSDPDSHAGEFYLHGEVMHSPDGWVPTTLPLTTAFGGARANLDGESCFVISGIGGTRAKRSTGWTSIPVPFGQRLQPIAADLGSGPELYAFHADSTNTNRLLSKFVNGAWQQVGPALFPISLNRDHLFALDTGAGPRLHVLHAADAGSPNPIYQYDGAAWTQVDAIEGTISAVTTFDVGDGAELIIAGDFPPAGPVTFNGLSRWNGLRLAPIGAGLGFQLGRTVTTIQTPTGPQLWAGGEGGQAYGYWTGSSWTRPYTISNNPPLGDSIPSVISIIPVNNPDGSRSIFLSGGFSEFAGMPAAGFTEIVTCPPSCTADINSDGETGTDADIEAFFACLAGNCCPTCVPADFNNDGDIGTDADIESFFRVLAGGPC